MNQNDLDKALKRHKHMVRGITTGMVLTALAISFIPHEYTSLTIAANAIANLWWIWAE